METHVAGRVGGDAPSEGDEALLVSVVVPVRDAVADARGLLSALSAQTLSRHRFEVLLGDDGSSDGLSDLVVAADGWLKILSSEPKNSYAARNRAAAAARAPILAFCDADCRPDPGWLQAGLSAVGDADIVAGLVRFCLPQNPSIWSLLDVDTFLDQERAVRNGCAATANLFVRRVMFEKAGGFDESLPNNGDYDFVARCVKNGARLRFSPGAAVTHPTRDQGSAFIRKVWLVNKAYAIRESRAGRRPSASRLYWWLPAIGTVRTRRHSGRSFALDRHRLMSSGVHPGFWDDVRAVPLIYLVVPYIRAAAQVTGWWAARRKRRS